MSTGFWSVRPTDLLDEVAAYASRIERAALAAAQIIGKAMEDDAQAGAPWQDQTGNARRGLFSAATLANDLLTLYLSHGPDVDYGKHLEQRWQGRYAIIWPTIQRHMDTVWAEIARQLG